MSNAGFNAATDIFSLGENWKVKDCNLNASVNTAECYNRFDDVTHRDQYGEKIAPTATYEIAAGAKSLPALGSLVTIDGKQVAISQIVVRTAHGQYPTMEVSGVQVQSGASKAVRTYDCGTVAIQPRKHAQDILKWLGDSTPDTLTEATFTFSANVLTSEPQGVIVNHDVSDGRCEAQYTHTSGTGTAPTVPAVSGSKVVSSPSSKSSPENDYVTYAFSITDTLTGTDITSS